MSEFDLIERIRARSRADDSVQIGIGDDAAVLAPTPGQMLVTTTDSLVHDRHFTAQWPPADIGHLAMAVNLSDLAAMGATPRWALLSLTLPDADTSWLDGFLDGFLALAGQYQVSLVGGNISSGPLNIGVQLLGEVSPDRIAARNGAQTGDLLAVTGTLGDAAAALALGPDADAALLDRLRRPQPRIEVGRMLAGRVHAMIDLSDGLAGDLIHLLGASLGACLEVAHLPASDALRRAVPDERERARLQLCGGNDYELLAAIDPAVFESAREACLALGLQLTPIGRINATGSLQCQLADGQFLEFDHGGWDHFKQG